MRWLPILALAACAGDRVGQGRAPLLAYCEAMVDGVGLVDVETDYLPRVINCENGGAGQAALEAQAVAARSYLYYRLDRTGSIGDGTGDQVYTCGREPGPQHYLAAASTAGVVLQYQGTQVAAFYVAGARNQPGPTCRGSTDDPTNTERYVTYNEDRSGDDVEQTTLGFVHPTNHANRGCKSQNDARCLADEGWDHDTILRFYYGADIEVIRADGPCVPSGEPDAGAGGDAGTGLDDDAHLEGGCACRAGAGARGGPGALLLLLLLLVATALRRGRSRPAPPGSL
jgi:MYXO-CTERM domain-containing protein